MAEAGRNSKTVAPLLELLAQVVGAAETQAENVKPGKAKDMNGAKGGSLLGSLKGMMSRKTDRK
jgi:hypothetical protein